MKRMIFGAGCTLLVALGLFFAAPPVKAQSILGAPSFQDRNIFEKQVPSAFAFLKVAPTARVAAMGDAYTAVADGMDAIYWNPAGLTGIEKMGYTFGYTQWFANIDFYSGAAAFKIGWGSVVGISVLSFQPPQSEETTILQPLGTGNMVEASDLAVGFVLAKQMTDKLSAGGVIRYVRSTLGPEELQTVVMSVGTLLRTGFRSLRIGMAMKHLGNEQTVVTEKVSMPIVFHVGSAMEVVGDLGDPVSLTAAFEGAYFTDRWQRWNLGGELWVREVLALRAGRKWRYDAETWSVGAGLKGGFSGHNFQVDVSYTDFGDLLEAPIRLTFSGSF
jgi:hypothetical protein